MRDLVADAAELLVTVLVSLFALEEHAVVMGHGRTFGDQDHRVVARMFAPVVAEQVAELLHVEGVLRDDAAVGGTGHGRQDRGEAGVAAEHFEDQEAFVRSGAGAQPVGQLDRPGDAGREADTVVGAGDVVVHGLRDGDHLDPFFVQPLAVAERVVAADRDEEVEAEEIEVLQDLRRDVVDRFPVSIVEVERDVGVRQVAGPGPRGMQERAAGPAGAVDNLLGQLLYAVAVVGLRVRDQVDQPGPAAPDADDPVALAQGPDGYGPDRRVRPGTSPPPVSMPIVPLVFAMVESP